MLVVIGHDRHHDSGQRHRDIDQECGERRAFLQIVNNGRQNPAGVINLDFGVGLSRCGDFDVSLGLGNNTISSNGYMSRLNGK